MCGQIMRWLTGSCGCVSRRRDLSRAESGTGALLVVVGCGLKRCLFGQPTEGDGTLFDFEDFGMDAQPVDSPRGKKKKKKKDR